MGDSNSARNRGLVSGSGEDRSYFCPACGVANTVKSNRALLEEYSRIRRLNRRTHSKHCQNEECENHGLSLDQNPGSYQRFGTTAKGDPRYRCKSCKKTFSIGSPTRRHKQTADTGAILKSLVNKVPLSRICEIHDVSLKQVHGKIDFLYRQVLAFCADREKKMASCLAGRHAYFSTDVQVILVNWPVKKRRGTIPLLHMATVHKYSQFVVAATVDYDPTVDPALLEEAMEACGDFDLPRDMRKHGRLWAASEYQTSLLSINQNLFSTDDLATGGVLNLPGRGCRVRGDAFMYAHMMLVKKLIGDQFRTANYCLDAEAGLAAAVCALNVAAIKSGEVNVAELSFEKGMTNDERNSLAAKGREELNKVTSEQAATITHLREEFSRLSEYQAAVLIHLEEKYEGIGDQARARLFARQGLEWPFHTKAEPNKVIKLKTCLPEMDRVQQARFFANASNHPVDAYFNFARRRVAGFERGLPTATNSQRIWHAYSYYNPEMVPKMAAILRFYYNYMLASGRDNQTPAMRLGLAKGKVYARDLLAYS